LRCVSRPEDAYAIPMSETSLSPSRRRPGQGIDGVLAYIHRHLAEQLPLEGLAAMAGLSMCRFATVFRQRVGVPPHRYICIQRVHQAQALLRGGMLPALVACETGFYDQSHLSRHFKSLCGMTPKQYLLRARDMAAGRR